MSKSIFTPPVSTNIHTIQSHIEESKLNEQLLNALVQFKSRYTGEGLENLGTIAINFYFNEEKNIWYAYFPHQEQSLTILEHLDQFLNTRLRSILKEVKFYGKEVNEYSLSYTKELNLNGHMNSLNN